MNAPAKPTYAPPPAGIRPFHTSWGARLLALALAIYAFYALGQLDFSAERFIKNVFIVSSFAVNYRHEQKNLPKRYQSRAICASPSPAGKCP